MDLTRAAFLRPGANSCSSVGLARGVTRRDIGLIMLTNDLAALIGVGCESILYGIYLVIFFLTLSFLTWRRHTREYNVTMIAGTCILFGLCTGHFALEFHHFYTTLASTGIDNFAAETKVLFASDILISVIDFFGDIMLLYRLWKVWNKNYWVTIAPFLTALGGFICAMMGLGILLNIDPDAPMAPNEIVPLGVAGFTLPLVTNFLITFLIVGRIYYLGSYRRKFATGTVWSSSSDKLNKASAILIESGTIYLVVQLVLVILFAIHHPAQGIVAGIAVQVYGIAPTLVSFRVGLGISPEQNQRTTTRSAMELRVPTFSRSNQARSSYINPQVSIRTNVIRTTDPEASDRLSEYTNRKGSDYDSVESVVPDAK